MTSYILGRGPNCDISFDDPYVSLQHARTWKDENDQVWIEDLGSVNGTFVNGIKILIATPIFAGYEIRIGRTILPWRKNVDIRI